MAFLPFISLWLFRMWSCIPNAASERPGARLNSLCSFSPPAPWTPSPPGSRHQASRSASPAKRIQRMMKEIKESGKTWKCLDSQSCGYLLFGWRLESDEGLLGHQYVPDSDPLTQLVRYFYFILLFFIFLMHFLTSGMLEVHTTLQITFLASEIFSFLRQ